MKLLPLLFVGVFAVPKSLTTDNFNELIHDTSKNVMIYFYRADCGESCAEIESVWEDFGRLMKKSDKLTIGSMDCESHESLCVSLSVQTTPIVLFFEHGKQPIKYTDKLDLESLHDYAKSINNPCSFENDTYCTENLKVLINELKTYPHRVDVGIKMWKKKIQDHQKEQDDALDSMRRTYDALRTKIAQQTSDLEQKIEIAIQAADYHSEKKIHDEL